MGSINKNTLDNLPANFDRSVIVHREIHRNCIARTLRLPSCDFMPIQRNHFKGWFVIPDVLNQGSTSRKSEIVKRIIDNGGHCNIVHVHKYHVEHRACVRVIDAFMDNGNVVIHIEPREDV